MTAPPPFDPASVRALVFDLDGTLVDSYGPITASLNHARAAFNLAALSPEFVRRHVGRGLESLVAEFVGDDVVEPGVRLFRERYEQVYAEGTSLLPEVRETLEALHDAGYRMAVASNKPARFTQRILAHLGLSPAIRCVAGPDVVGSHKPDPAMIRYCLDRLGADPRHAVYVGDMVLDVESAARAGLPVLLVSGGSSKPSDLARTGQRLLRSFAELRAVLPTEPFPRAGDPDPSA